jgi:hypothetical protein
MVIASRRLALPKIGIPPAVIFFWLLHVGISLGFGFYLQANPELPEAPWFSSPDWAGNLAHWDVNWEMRIADQGYGPDFVPQTSAKFPLAALSARLIHQLLGVSIQVALFIVNKFGVLVGFWALWRLVNRLFDPLTAHRAVGYMACALFGTGFIYWMSYPDPLFLAWWALAFDALFAKQYYRAGLWATLAVWTRPQGALLLPVFALSILVNHLRTHGFRATFFGRAFWANVFSACLIPSLALIAWVIRVSDVTLIPFSPYAAQQDVRQTGLIWPWQRIIQFVDDLQRLTQFTYIGMRLEAVQLILVGLLLVVLGVLSFRRKLPWELSLFSLMCVFLPLMTAIFAVGRFATMTFLPVGFVFLVPVKYRRLDILLWVIGLLLSMLVFIVLNMFSLQIYYVP